MRFNEVNPEGITGADIVVGIPSFNEASSISYPVQQADKGLQKYFNKYSSVMINCDNASPDNTKDAFLNTKTAKPKIYISTDPGVTGKGNNLRNLFEKAVELSAKAVLIIDADLRSITPLWIRNLGEPLLEEYEFVAPLYVRHKYDGTLTNNIAYPLTRALYGRRVRQPIGGDYGVSGDLAKRFIESDVWNSPISQYGIDIWMTTTALRNKVGVVQAFIGKSKIHRTRDTFENSKHIFPDLMATMFELMCRYDAFWREVKWSRPTAVFGFGAGEVEVPPAVELNSKALWERFSEGLKVNWELYRTILSEQNFNKLQEAAELSPECFEMPTELWAKILYDFAVAYKKNVTESERLIESLLPLYFGKTLSFVLETQAMNNQQVEEYIEDQCLQFERAKPYLVERWTSI